MDELEQALHKANPYTSPGESGIPTEIRKLAQISNNPPRKRQELQQPTRQI